jgi:hypothetical protein
MQNEQNVYGEDQKQVANTETISELAHRHLNDRNHTTTDEEFRNATLELPDHIKDVPGEELFEVDNTTIIPPLPGEESGGEESIENDKDKEGNNNTVPNPYDVLG